MNRRTASRQGAYVHGSGIATTGPDDRPLTIAWDNGR